MNDEEILKGIKLINKLASKTRKFKVKRSDKLDKTKGAKNGRKQQSKTKSKYHDK